jgi:hypothetical protein
MIRSTALALLCSLAASAVLAQGNRGKLTPPPPPPRPRATCTIEVEIIGAENAPPANVEVQIGLVSRNGPRPATSAPSRTNGRGLVSAKLPCGRDYLVTPALQGFDFLPREERIRLSRKSVTLSFRAEPKAPPPAATPPEEKPPLLPCNPKFDAVEEIRLGESASFSRTLSPQNSACTPLEQNAGDYLYYDRYRLTGALGGDLLEIELQQTGALPLMWRIKQLNNQPLPDFNGEIPGPGDYLVDVFIKHPIASRELKADYMITIRRTGLSDAGIARQLRRVAEALGQAQNPDIFDAVFAALRDQSREIELNKVINLLAPLKQLAPQDPVAYEIHGALAFHQKGDLIPGIELLMQAVEKGGGARFGVHQGEDLDKFPYNIFRTGWLVVSKGRIEFHDPKSRKTEFQTTTDNIKKCGVRENGRVVYFYIKGSKRSDSADFFPWSKEPAAVKAIMNFLKQYVSGDCKP